jgi:hypothetical protein
MISSTKVFHSLHEGHLPTHFVLSWPQLLQKKAVFVLLIIFLFESNEINQSLSREKK